MDLKPASFERLRALHCNEEDRQTREAIGLHEDRDKAWTGSKC